MKRILMLLCALVPLAVVPAADVDRITPKEADRLVKSGRAVLVDVREPKEWAATGVAAPAELLPKSDFDGAQKQWKDFLAHVGGKKIILYCHSGFRAGLVAAALADQGFSVLNAGPCAKCSPPDGAAPIPLRLSPAVGAGRAGRRVLPSVGAGDSGSRGFPWKA